VFFNTPLFRLAPRRQSTSFAKPCASGKRLDTRAANRQNQNLGDNGVDYEVKYWLEDLRQVHDTDALVRQRIWYAFRARA
jgi:hypothetical protein